MSARSTTITVTLRRCARAVAISVLATLVSVLALAPPAQAATYTRSFSTTKSYFSADLARCIVVTLSGKITYDLKSETGGMYYRNRKLLAPKVTVATTNHCGSTSQSRMTVSKLTVTQAWYDDVCSLNGGISAGYPWGVSASVTPVCGNVKVANRRTTYSSTGSSFTQSNSNTAVSFKNGGLFQTMAYAVNPHDRNAPRKWLNLCHNATATVTAYRGTKSDTIKLNFKPCFKH